MKIKNYLLFFFLSIPLQPIFSSAPKSQKNTYSIVAKLNFSGSSISEIEKIITTKLSHYKSDIQQVKIKKLFPNHQKPESKRLIDLSALVEISCISSFESNLVKNQLFKTGFFEYIDAEFEKSKIQPLSFQPNDPYSDTLNFKSKISLQDSAGGAWHLNRINAYRAWQIHKGDTNSYTAIIDWGVNYLHEDLSANLKYNFDDPIDGIDNDHNGYIDDFKGWDFGMNDNDPLLTCQTHGTGVTSMAAATPNNAKGLTGSGYFCKYKGLKINADGSGCPVSFASLLYSIVYAADNGAKVINLSLDVGGFYQVVQDVINYAVINKNVAVVAAAGQNYSFSDIYPASHDNVLSVAMADFYNCKATDATYSYFVDLAAPGKHVWGILNGSSIGYDKLDGSSFSAPLVAGALTLLRSKYPHFSARQAMEQIRVSAKNIENFSTVCGIFDASQYKEKLGKGILDMEKALSDTTLPAVRFDNYHFQNFSGGTSNLYFTFENLLSPVSNLKVNIRSLSPLVEVLDSTKIYGSFSSLELKENSFSPFVISVSSGLAQNQEVLFRIGFSDVSKSYEDYQYVKLILKKDFINIDANFLKLTITPNGRMGYADFAQTQGQGLNYWGTPFNPVLLESGLLIGLNSSVVSNCIVNSSGTANDNHFKSIHNPHYIYNPAASQTIENEYSDSLSSSPIGIRIKQKTFASQNAPNHKYILVEYTLQNLSGNMIDSLSIGLFNQWAIGDNIQLNKANWDCETKTVYAFEGDKNKTYLGLTLISDGEFSHFSMNNSNGVSGNINPIDGFTNAEKFAILSGSQTRDFANSVSGNNTSNVSNLLSTKIYNLLPNQAQKVVFAYVAGDIFSELKQSANQAKKYYRMLNAGAKPTIEDTVFVYNSTIASKLVIKPNEGTKFNFYNSITGCNLMPFFSGNSLTIDGISLPYTFWVSNADSVVESEKKNVVVATKYPYLFLTSDGSNFTEFIPITGNKTYYFTPVNHQNKLFIQSNVPWNIQVDTSFIAKGDFYESNYIIGACPDGSEISVPIIKADKGYVKFSKMNGIANDTILIESSTMFPPFEVTFTGISINKILQISGLAYVLDYYCPSEVIKNQFSTISIFPNPTNGILFVNIQNPQDAKDLKIFLINSYGQRFLVQENKNRMTNKLDLTNFAKGIYTLELANSIKKHYFKLVLE